jgi:UDPglucose 6-dehydrogenase
MVKIKIGLVGVGVIGGALKTYIENYNDNALLFMLDPLKGYNDSLQEVDVAFINIHIPTNKYGGQDTADLKNIIKSLPDKPIFIRTTLLPGTCDKLSKEFSREIYFMPEFLTERIAYEDFCRHKIICTGRKELLAEIFIDKDFIEMSNASAEILKYVHNVFGALKVTFFNGVYELCRNSKANYEDIIKGLQVSGHINKMYTQVPGPDGKFGYGGKCFPKDVDALLEFVGNLEGGGKAELYNLLNAVQNSNLIYRNKK